MIAASSQGLYGEHRPLRQFVVDKSVRGIGMSDWVGYADRLERLFNYTNTFYDTDPKLDITAVPPEMAGTLDFMLSSDVFELVVPPVVSAFENARHLLKPGGLLVLTVHYRKDGVTEEHFPELHDFEIAHRDGRLFLFNTTRDGRKQVFEDLIFHGGPGQTLEMRLFSEQRLLDALRAAGFSSVSFQARSVFEHGVWWADEAGVPPLARA